MYSSDTVRIVRGDTASFQLVFRDCHGDPVVFEDVVEAMFTAKNHDEVLHGEVEVNLNKIIVGVTADVAGRFRADVQLTFSDGRVQTPWIGFMDVIEDVTK